MKRVQEKPQIISTEYGKARVYVSNFNELSVGPLSPVRRPLRYRGKAFHFRMCFSRLRRGWRITETSEETPGRVCKVIATAIRTWAKTEQEYIRREAIKRLRWNVEWFSTRPPSLGSWSIHHALSEAQELVDEAIALGRPRIAKRVRGRLLDVSARMEMTALRIRTLLEAA